jgi:hypothetical protein
MRLSRKPRRAFIGHALPRRSPLYAGHHSGTSVRGKPIDFDEHGRKISHAAVQQCN